MGHADKPYIAGIARGMLALGAALMAAQVPMLAHAEDAAGYSINIYDHVQSTASATVHNPYAGKEACYGTDVLKGTITATGCSEDPFLVDGAAIKLRDPMREGHVFKGWSIAGSSGAPQQGPTVDMASVSSDVEYVANWEPSVYSVGYDAHGGEFERGVVSYVEGEDPSSLSDSREDSYSYGSQIELADPDRKGMAFSKWKVSTGGPYDIIYELDGGYFSASPKTSYRTSDAAFTLPSPSRQGYSFAGWTGSNGASPQKSVAVAKGSSGTKAYKANWTPIAYTVSYALGDGTFGGAAARTGYAAGDDFMLPKPTMRGYAFTGWTGSNGTVPETDVTIKYGPIGNRSYTANWSLMDYAISYVLNGGAFSQDPVSSYNMLTPTFTLPKPEKEGYNFDGWADAGADGAAPVIDAQIESGSIGDRSYAAHWIKSGEVYIVKRISDLNTQLLAQNIKADLDDTMDEDIKGDSLDAHGASDQVQEETAESFPWVKNINSSIGSMTIDSTGKNINFKGNSSNAGSNAIWYVPSQGSEQKFTFNYSLDFGDSFNSAGFLLRVKDSNPESATAGTISGYALVLGHTTSSQIAKFSRPKNTTANISWSTVQTLSISQSGTITATATNTYIEIVGGGVNQRVNLDSSYVISSCGPGYGFYSDHYSHGCDNIGNFDIKNLDLVTTTVLSMKDVIGGSGQSSTGSGDSAAAEPIFERSDSIHFLVNIDSKVDPGLTDQALIDKLKAENVHIIFVGSNENKASAQAFIDAVGAGTFILSTNNEETDAANISAYMHTVLQGA